MFRGRNCKFHFEADNALGTYYVQCHTHCVLLPQFQRGVIWIQKTTVLWAGYRITLFKIKSIKTDNINGYIINFKKSVLTPTQRIIFCGLIIDTVEFKFSLQRKKWSKIKSLCVEILLEQIVPIHKFASLICLIVHPSSCLVLRPSSVNTSFSIRIGSIFPNLVCSIFMVRIQESVNFMPPPSPRGGDFGVKSVNLCIFKKIFSTPRHRPDKLRVL